MTNPMFDMAKEYLDGAEKKLKELEGALRGWKQGVEKCKLCRGTGIVEVADEPDDFTHAFCTCEAGRELEGGNL